MPTASAFEPSEPQTVRAMPGVSLGPITTAPAPSPSRNEMLRSVGSTTSESFSAPIDERVVRGAGADERVGLGDGVGEAGARGVHVVGGGGVRADAVGDDRRHRRRLLHVADRRDDDDVDRVRGRRRTCAIASRAASVARSIAETLGAGARARDDAGALLDPLVAGVDRADEVVVRDGDLAASGAVRVDAGVRGAVRLLRGWASSCSAFSSCPVRRPAR